MQSGLLLHQWFIVVLISWCNVPFTNLKCSSFPFMPCLLEFHLAEYYFLFFNLFMFGEFWLTYLWASVFHHHLLKRISFLYWLLWCICQKSNDHMTAGLFLGYRVCFCWSICESLCHCLNYCSFIVFFFMLTNHCNLVF